MSFTAPTDERTGPVLPLAAMVDILFLLLIFFMTTSVFRESDQQIDVSLPPSQSGAVARSPTQIIITITEDDRIYIAGREHSLDELFRALTRLSQQALDDPVVIRADGSSRWNTGIRIMDMANSLGFRRVFVGTRGRPGEPG